MQKSTQLKTATAIATLGILLLVGKYLWLSDQIPWYAYPDQDAMHITDAWSINSGFCPHTAEHPGTPATIMLTLLFRVVHAVDNQVPCNLDFISSLRQNPHAIQFATEWAHRLSLGMTIILAVCCGVIAWLATESIILGGIGLLLIAIAPSISFCSVMYRTELPSVMFSCMAWMIYLLGKHKTNPVNIICSCIAGFLLGLALLTKIQVVFMVLMPGIFILGNEVLQAHKQNKHNAQKPDFNLQQVFLISCQVFLLPFFNILFFGMVFLFAGTPVGRIVLPFLHVKLILVCLFIATIGSFCFPHLLATAKRLSALCAGYLAVFPSFFIFFIQFCSVKKTTAFFSIMLHHLCPDFITGSPPASVYMSSVNHGYGHAIFKFFEQFMNWGIPLLVVCAFALLLPQKNHKNRLLIFFGAGCGIGYWFISALRYYTPRYDIYSDLFFILSTIVALNAIREKLTVSGSMVLKFAYVILLTVGCIYSLYKSFPIGITAAKQHAVRSQCLNWFTQLPWYTEAYNSRIRQTFLTETNLNRIIGFHSPPIFKSR